MSAREMIMAELLEKYLEDLEANPNAQPPKELDGEMIEAAQKMHAHFAAPEPSPEFSASLRETLHREATQVARTQKQSSRGVFGLPRWVFAGLGLALVIALGGFLFVSTRPAPASAEQVLNHALSVANNLNASGVKSFELQSESEQPIFGDAQHPNGGISHTSSSLEYGGPSLWREESTIENLSETVKTLNVSDGATLWTYDAFNNIVTADVATGDGPPLPNVGSLALLNQGWSNCYTPNVVGEEEVAGRAAYKVDLGENKCRSASLPQFEGTRTLWLDKETFFVLRDDFVGKDGKQNLGAYRVTRVSYNVEIPKAAFQFTPPQGAKIQDNRPKPAPGPDQFETQLQALAKSTEYPVFAPKTPPNGLVPRVPKVDPTENQIRLEYVPPEEASTNTIADSHGVVILEGRATYEMVRNWTDGAEKFEIDGNQAWVRRGDFNAQLNTGANSAVMLVRDGTLVSISSFSIKPDQLIEIAKTLEPVAGGHAPLPNPTPPSLDQVRAQSDFPFLIPTYVPEGLKPEPPTSHQVQYHRADGSIGLIVQNAKIGEGGMESDSRFDGTHIKLANGVEAHQLEFEPQIVILWWHQENGYVSLEGHGIAADEMLKIAASMSSTAELGEVENPPARPTPTPVPAPSFTILRPSVLPEKMTVTEINVPSPDGKSAGIEIHFDPHPDSEPHDTMTLTEFPKQFAETITDDRAVTQEIGGRSVTIIKIGQGCVTYSWTQGDVALVLTNPYDPPGEPGQVRYGCEVMERVIASIE